MRLEPDFDTFTRPLEHADVIRKQDAVIHVAQIAPHLELAFDVVVEAVKVQVCRPLRKAGTNWDAGAGLGCSDGLNCQRCTVDLAEQLQKFECAGVGNPVRPDRL